MGRSTFVSIPPKASLPRSCSNGSVPTIWPIFCTNMAKERFSRRIARRIVERRQQSPITTADDLAQIVRSAVPNARSQRIDAATRTFQALRIAVNGELDCLEASLTRLPNLLALGGRLAIISFHSLEDRLVKQAFRDNPLLKVITRKPDSGFGG